MSGAVTPSLLQRRPLALMSTSLPILTLRCRSPQRMTALPSRTRVRTAGRSSVYSHPRSRSRNRRRFYWLQRALPDCAQRLPGSAARDLLGGRHVARCPERSPKSASSSSRISPAGVQQEPATSFLVMAGVLGSTRLGVGASRSLSEAQAVNVFARVANKVGWGFASEHEARPGAPLRPPPQRLEQAFVQGRDGYALGVGGVWGGSWRSRDVSGGCSGGPARAYEPWRWSSHPVLEST